MSENTIAIEKIREFFEDQGYGFCLPFLNRTLSEREINKLAECIRSIGLKQYWIRVRITLEKQQAVVSDILLIMQERALEGKNYFLQIFKYLSNRFGLAFMIYKADTESLYKVPANSMAMRKGCNYEPLDINRNKSTPELMVELLGVPCTMESVVLQLHSLDGFNGALLRETIRDKIIIQGSSYFDSLFAKKYSTHSESDKTFADTSTAPELWLQCPLNSEISNFFAPDKSLYMFTCTSDENMQLGKSIQLANLELLLDALELNYILAASKDQKSIFLQSTCPVEDERLIKDILTLAPQMPIYATVKTLESDFGDLSDYTPIQCHIGEPTLSSAAKRGYFNVIARYRPAAFESYLYSLAQVKHQIQLKNDALLKLNPLAAIILEEKCGCFDLKKLDNEKAEQLIKILSDAGYGLKSLTRESAESSPQFLVLKQGGESDNLFIQLLLSCMDAASSTTCLFRSFYGPLFQINPDKKISFLCNVYEISGKKLNEMFATIFPVNAGEIIQIKTLAPATGMRLITKRALLASTLQEYGFTAIQKMLGDEVEPEPFFNKINTGFDSK